MHQLADTPIAQILERWKDPARDITATLHEVWTDAPWAYFTNGAFFVGETLRGLPVLGDAPVLETPAWDPEARSIIRAIEQAPCETVSIAWLLSLAGERPPGRWNACDACLGSGKVTQTCDECGHDHECKCPECDRGRVVPPRRIVEVDDRHFGRRYVAELAYYVAEEGDVQGAVIDAPGKYPEAGWLILRSGVRLGAVVGCQFTAVDEELEPETALPVWCGSLHG